MRSKTLNVDVRPGDGELVRDPGRRDIVVSCEGRRPWREELHLSAGQRAAYTLNLEPERTGTAFDVHTIRTR